MALSHTTDGRRATARLQKAAKDLLHELLAEQSRNGRVRLSAQTPFRFYAAAWCRKIERWKLKQGTRSDYQSIVRNILIPCLCDKPLSEIERADVEEIIDERVEGYAPRRKGSRCKERVSVKTALNEVAVLRHLMNDAIQDGLVTANPCDRIEEPDHEARERVFLRRDQLDAFVAEIPKDHRTLLRVLGHLGLRLGEALALRVSDFNPALQQLTIDRAWRRASKESPKTESGYRVLPLSKAMADGLQRHIVKTLGNPGADALLFPGPAGGHMDAGHWRTTIFYPAARRAGLPDATVPHSLRHTAAVLMLQAGRSMDQVRATLGHSSIQITIDLYGRRSAGEFGSPADTL